MNILAVLGLAVRWFFLAATLVLVCAGIALSAWAYRMGLRFQLALIRWSGLCLFAVLAMFCSACATHPAPVNYAPSPAAVVRSVTQAKEQAASLRSEVTTPAGLRTLDQLNASLDSSLTAVSDYAGKVDALSVELGKAQEQATYWKAKHSEALRGLWHLRIIILAEIIGVLAWLGLRYGAKAFIP